ncbi:MAG: hypothetical protein VYE44_08605, partial [Verrucomicrobiota bacterium]|nr:hypothetical protein [Verrucomicrobiota bacterium]
KPCGTILAGIHPVAVDMTAATLMGFDWQKLRLLKGALEIQKRSFIAFQPNDISLASNMSEWAGPLSQAGGFFAFQPHFGWVGVIERESENGSKQ